MMDVCPASPANDHHLHHQLHHHHNLQQQRHHHHQQQQQQHTVENRKRPLPDTLDGANVKRTHCSASTGKSCYNNTHGKVEFSRNNRVFFKKNYPSGLR